MSAQPKTSGEGIALAARELVERHGAAGLTMQAVATAVGIRAPSLYKRYANRAAVLEAVGELTGKELGAAMGRAATPGKVRRSVKAMARACRDYARRRPASYELIGREKGAEAVRERFRQALLERVGEKRAAVYARAIEGFVRGMAGVGEEGDEAFESGVEAIVEGALGGAKG